MGKEGGRNWITAQTRWAVPWEKVASSLIEEPALLIAELRIATRRALSGRLRRRQANNEVTGGLPVDGWTKYSFAALRCKIDGPGSNVQRMWNILDIMFY